MTDDPRTAEQKLADHLALMNARGAVPMTAEEILSGQIQAGVPRPAFLADDAEDGSVEFVGTGKKDVP